MFISFHHIFDIRIRAYSHTSHTVLQCQNHDAKSQYLDTINTFKNRLDKFWSDQEVLYDYNTDLHGIGNRSLL